MRFRPILTLALLSAASCTGAKPIPSMPLAAPLTPAALTQMPIVELDARSAGPVVNADAYGANMNTWYDFQQAFVNPSLRKAAIHLVRWPGGSESDAYHWENGGSICDDMGYITKGATFDNFMTRVATPLHLDIAITLNYGSNRACDAGGQPSEAAAWVADAKRHGYRVTNWTVGNEVYGSWEYDLHARPHDPVTYSDAVRTGYYPAVKKANPDAKLGVVVDLPSDHAWNDVVLRKAQPFDFVELHYYPEYNNDNDQALLGPDVDNFAKDLTGLRAEMDKAGVAKTVPIYLGEYNNDAGNEGKQSVSIVNGLFLGQMIGTLLHAGVPMSTWWLAYGSCDETGDYSKKLYGFQHFGSEALFSDGLPNADEGCAKTPKIPGGTPFPTARVLTLIANQVPDGSQVLATTVAQSVQGNIRAYGFALKSGYALALFNNTLSSITIKAEIHDAKQAHFNATQIIYGAKQYAESKQDKWIGPELRSYPRVGTTIPLTLPAYSVSMLVLK